MKTRKPEQPTIAERLVGMIPTRYSFAALLWSLVIGSPAYLTIEYLERGTSTFRLTPSNLLTEVLFSLFPFYVFYMPRYMRLKIVSAEKEVEPLMLGREAAYHEAFGMVSSTGPVVVLTTVLGTVAIPLSGFEPRLSALNLFDVVSVYLSSLGFATYLWVYASSSWGLHKLGSAPIELRPFFEDRMMGVKAIGTLALSLTVAYFGGLLFLTLLFFPFFATNPFYTALILGFLLVGVAMFFLPLISIHGRMQAEKQLQRRLVGLRFRTLVGQPGSSSENPSDESGSVENRLAKLIGLQELEMTERRVSGIPTWPFDIQVVGKFVTIILSITAVLLSRVIAAFLHI